MEEKRDESADLERSCQGVSAGHDACTYAQVLDQNRFDAMKKLEALRLSSISNGVAPETVQPTNQEMKPQDRTKSQ